MDKEGLKYLEYFYVIYFRTSVSGRMALYYYINNNNSNDNNKKIIFIDCLLLPHIMHMLFDLTIKKKILL